MSSPGGDDALALLRDAMPQIMRGAPGLRNDVPVELLRNNNLAPLAYKLGVAGCRAEYAASSVMTMRRAGILSEVARAFSGANVWAALLKGIGYTGTIYLDPAERPMVDIDLLVPPKQLTRAITCMFDLGFERVGMGRKLSGYYHAIVFNRGGNMVELHRNMMQLYRTDVDADAMWDRATVDARAGGLRRLDPVDDLLMSIAHIARHELAVPAINYVDVFRAQSRLDDRQKDSLHELAKTSNVVRAVTCVVEMTTALAEARSGSPFSGALAHILPTTEDVLLRRRPPRWRQIAQKLLLTEGPRQIAGLGYSAARTYLHGALRTRAVD